MSSLPFSVRRFAITHLIPDGAALKLHSLSQSNLPSGRALALTHSTGYNIAGDAGGYDRDLLYRNGFEFAGLSDIAFITMWSLSLYPLLFFSSAQASSV
jgi:hypothetical protein